MLDRLKSTLDFSKIELVDYWDADLCAIGLKRGNNLIYISTFAHLHATTPLYDYQLEIDKENSTPQIISEMLTVDEIELLNTIKTHLKMF